MKPWMGYALAGAGGLVLGTVVAKYTLPPRVETKIEEKVVEKVRVEWKEKVVREEGPTRTIVRTKTVPGPAGPTVEVEKIVEKEKVVTVRDNSGTGAVDTKIVEKIVKVEDARAWFALEGFAGWGLSTGAIAWAANGQVRVLGPVWLGAGVFHANDYYPGALLRLEF